MPVQYPPLSLESRLEGLIRINALLEDTLSRKSNGLRRTDYVARHGANRATSTKLLRAGNTRSYSGDFEKETVIKLAKMILVPGSQHYYGDTPELLSEFVMIFEGWLDGYPPHLQHLKTSNSRSYTAMSLEELEAEQRAIEAVIEERTIDLEGVVVVDRFTNALLDNLCVSKKITRNTLAESTIGKGEYKYLIGSDRVFTEAEIAPIAERLGMSPPDLLALRDVSISQWRARDNMDRDIAIKTDRE
jgi:hypothetical protein